MHIKRHTAMANTVADWTVPQARLFAGAGISKIRLTGGEPTLRSDITELTGQLAGVPGIAHVGITTNGIALSRKLPDLQAAGASLCVQFKVTGGLSPS